MKAIVFPGQGSQRAGMGKALFDDFPEITRRADDVLGYSIKALCLSNEGGRLSSTYYAQPAIYVVNALHLIALQQDGLQGVTFAAGHSLGEYSALLAAGVFDFEVGLQIVKRRGELFSQVNNGSMVAVLGLDRRTVRHLLAEAGGDVTLANLNSEYQSVLSGSCEEIERLQTIFEKAGCALYQPLDVSGAYHSLAMSHIKQQFAEFLKGFSFNLAHYPVISNVTARPYGEKNVAGFLAEQVDHPVKWSESIHYLFRNGVTEIIEVGHGRVLTKICNAIRHELPVAI